MWSTIRAALTRPRRSDSDQSARTRRPVWRAVVAACTLLLLPLSSLIALEGVASAQAVGTPSPASGIVGSTTTVAVSGYVATHSLTVTVDSVTATVNSGGTTDGTGAASVNFTIPPVPNGTQTVVVSDGTNNDTTSFTVNAAASGLSPTSGAIGTSATVTAQGFIASHALTVTVNGVSATVTGGSPTDATGSATLTFTVPTTTSGAQAVVVSDGTNTAGAGNFTISSAASLNSPSPTSGPVGQSVTVTGSGFIANHTLTVTVAG
ncbi:MAG TPA: hypothetical protein VNF07_08765, partial [Acidimicrobiales bacterium]|nr:hypothetical protein [Acidimicrobiales bacterium]